MPSICFGSHATFQFAALFDKSLKDPFKRTTCQQSFCHCRREWSFSKVLMEVNAGSSQTATNEKQLVEHSTSADKVNKPTEKEVTTSVFVNHAAIAWDDSRRKWTGHQAQQPQRKSKDQIISWLTTYEELLSTNEPFSEPIPLPEMVDFLVDIWQDEGLYD